MDLVRQEELFKKIKRYLDCEKFESEDLSGNLRTKEFAKINGMFGNFLDGKEYILNLRKISVNNKVFYTYDTITVDKQKRPNNIVLCKDDKPLLLLTKNSSRNKECESLEETITTYDKETSRIVSKVKINSLKIYDTEVLDVVILDKNNDEYYRKNYKFYYGSSKIVAYQIGDEKFLTYDDARDARLDMAISKIEKVSKKVRSSVDDILDINTDYVKEYKIKRKNS